MIIKLKRQVNGLLGEAMSTLEPDAIITTMRTLNFISELQITQCFNNFRKAAFNDDAAI